MRHGLSIRYDDRHDEVIASYPTTHHVMVFDGVIGAVSRRYDTRTAGLRYPCGVTFLPDGAPTPLPVTGRTCSSSSAARIGWCATYASIPCSSGHSHIDKA